MARNFKWARPSCFGGYTQCGGPNRFCAFGNSWVCPKAKRVSITYQYNITCRCTFGGGVWRRQITHLYAFDPLHWVHSPSPIPSHIIKVEAQKCLEVNVKVTFLSKKSHRPSPLCWPLQLSWCLCFDYKVQSHCNMYLFIVHSNPKMMPYFNWALEDILMKRSYRWKLWYFLHSFEALWFKPGGCTHSWKRYGVCALHPNEYPYKQCLRLQKKDI